MGFLRTSQNQIPFQLSLSSFTHTQTHAHFSLSLLEIWFSVFCSVVAAGSLFSALIDTYIKRTFSIKALLFLTVTKVQSMCVGLQS